MLLIFDCVHLIQIAEGHAVDCMAVGREQSVVLGINAKQQPTQQQRRRQQQQQQSHREALHVQMQRRQQMARDQSSTEPPLQHQAAGGLGADELQNWADYPEEGVLPESWADWEEVDLWGEPVRQNTSGSKGAGQQSGSQKQQKKQSPSAQLLEACRSMYKNAVEGVIPLKHMCNNGRPIGAKAAYWVVNDAGTCTCPTPQACQKGRDKLQYPRTLPLLPMNSSKFSLRSGKCLKYLSWASSCTELEGSRVQPILRQYSKVIADQQQQQQQGAIDPSSTQPRSQGRGAAPSRCTGVCAAAAATDGSSGSGAQQQQQQQQGAVDPSNTQLRSQGRGKRKQPADNSQSKVGTKKVRFADEAGRCEVLDTVAGSRLECWMHTCASHHATVQSEECACICKGVCSHRLCTDFIVNETPLTMPI